MDYCWRLKVLQGVDVNFALPTKAPVEESRLWGGIADDGIVSGQTWSVSLPAVSSTSETAVGPNFVVI